MFALIPLGGSYEILSDLCRRDIGNLGCGFEDMNSLNVGFTFYLNTTSMMDSSSGRREIDKWQLAKNTQFPFSAPSVRILFAFSLCPLPSEIDSTF